MSLPYVRINFANGAIGGSAAMDDGCTGLICSATPLNDTFDLDTNYLITSLDDLVALGIDAESDGANANVYKCVKEFYDEAPKGTKLYLRGFRETITIDELVNKSEGFARPLLEYAHGNIRTLMVKVTDEAGYDPVVVDGLDERVYSAVINAQALAEDATEDLKAPLLVLLEGRHYNGVPGDLTELDSFSCNRVAVVIGDTVPDSDGACVGLLAGRIARIPVQRSIGRVKDGPVKATALFIKEASGNEGNEVLDNGGVHNGKEKELKKAPALYIKNVAAESGHPDLIHDSGFICPRTFVGKAGYYWSDDKLAAPASDDYCLIPRRRTIDKAYRIAYLAMIEQVSEEIAVTNEGKIAAAVCKNMETVMESAIINQMTSVGNLATDPEDPNDTGVVAYVDPNQNIVATSRLNASLRVRPYGYAKYIEVDLGFQTLNTSAS